MPPEVRQAYLRLLAQVGDKDKDGIPDVLQHELDDLGRHGVHGNVLGVTKTTITVNGKTYGSVADMPEDVRALYEKAMAQAGAAPSGVSASLGPDKSPGVHVSYSYGTTRGGRDQDSSSGSRTVFLILLGAMLGGVMVWMLLK
jgi:hypothetical protein